LTKFLSMLYDAYPRSPQGCSAGVLSVNGERRLRPW